MTKPKIIIDYEQVPESYTSPDIWVVVHRKLSQKVFADSIRDIINSALEMADFETEARQ